MCSSFVCRVHLALTAGDKEAYSLLCSSSLHSALSSADGLISCSVFCLCSATLEKQ